MIAIFVVVLLVASTMPFMLAAKAQSVSAASAAAVTEVKVGWLSEIVFWNPMNIEMVEDYVACYLMFSSLFMYDQDWNGPVNDLATGYTQVVNPDDTMTTTIDITANAYFRNKANPEDSSHPLTASDVKYTFDRIIANPGGAWDTYLENITSITVISPTRLEIVTDYVKATLIDDLSQIPIIPEYMWSGVADNKFLTAKDPAWLVGSGPFFYNASTTTWYRFTTAPYYHGATDYPGVRDVGIGSILYTVYGDPGALTVAMNSGVEDTIALLGQPNLFVNQLGVNPSVNIIKYAIQEPGICDVAVNAIPLDFRTQTYATGNPLLLDHWVRLAIFMTLNKQSIDDDLMLGLVTQGDSVVQPNFWHKDISPEVPYDPAGAMTLLEAHGYSDTDSDGYLEATDTAVPVVQGWADVGDELAFRLHAPNNEPSYMSIGQNWVTWGAAAGIRFNYAALSESLMTNKDWFKADYDIWVWHWGWGPEPLGSVLSTWLSKEIRPGYDNCQMQMGPWYYTPVNSSTGVAYSAYDENFSVAQRTLDQADRKILVDKLQQWIYDSYTELVPFYDLGLYAYTDQRFVGWGDWSAHVGRSICSDLPWLWFDLEPVANVSPIFNTPLNPAYNTVVGGSVTFQVEVSDADGDPLEVNWTFGDGSPMEKDTLTTGTSTPQPVIRSHTYTAVNEDPGYPVTVTVWDAQAGHQRQTTSVVYVTPTPDNPPRFTSAIGYSPAPPQYGGTTIHWYVNATDDESGGSGFGLRFTWSWGDGTFTASDHTGFVNGTSVMDHQTKVWNPSIETIFDVEVWIWDGEPGHNISIGGVTPYTIKVDQDPDPPTVSPISGTEGLWIECTASSRDPDPGNLRFTWAWDDGTYNVTDHVNSAPGTIIQSVVSNMWPTAGTYDIVVYVDDLNGHNVSSPIITADISPAGANTAPTGIQLSIEAPTDPAQWLVGTELTFNASAIDADSDAMSAYVTFGDGAAATATTPGGVITRQYVDPKFLHTYDTDGVYTVDIWFDDGQGHNVTSSIDVTIQPLPVNEPPWLTIQSLYGTKWNTSLTIVPAHAQDNDTDELHVWYDWGDGTPITEGDSGAGYSASHTYMTLGDKTLTVSANDTAGGHNVSETATVRVTDNLKPAFVGGITKTPAKAEYNETDTITFSVTIRDYEGDNVTLAIEFGDGSDTTETFDPAPNTTWTETFTHTYGAGSGRIDPYAVNVTAMDDKQHFSMAWEKATTNVVVAEPEEEPPPPDEEAFPWALVAGAIIAVIVILAIALLLMKRKKGGAEQKGGMEGMAPPEQAPPPPPPA